MLKRYLDIAYLFVLALLLSIQTFGQHITGSGSSGDPYILYNAADVDSIRYLGIGDGNYFQLNNNIDLSGYADWAPIGTSTTPFIGTFDGGGYTISGLRITTSTGYAGNFGFFGYSQSSTIRNVNFYDCKIDWASATTFTNNNTSIVAGQPISCSFKNIIITKCSLVVASANKTIRFGFAGGYSQSSTYYRVGVDSSYISVPSGNQHRTGFLVGQSFGGSVSQCYATNSTAILNCNAGYGGFIGVNTMSIVDSYVFNVQVTDALTNNTAFAQVGTFVGSTGSGHSTTRVYSGKSSALYTNFTPDKRTSFFGYQSYNAGATTIVDTSGNGVFCFNVNAGTPPVSVTAAEMIDTATFSAFPDTTWGMNPGRQDGYPYLLWIPYASVVITNPTTGQTYNYDDTLTIEWTATESEVLFYYTTNGGDDWIFKDTISGGSYDWDFVGDLAFGMHIKVKLTLLDDSAEDIAGSFTTNPNFVLSSPIGGETYFYGDTVSITYASTFDTVKIYYSTNSGTDWIYLGIDTNSVSYSWVIPEITTRFARVLITSTDSSYTSESANSFNIFSRNAFISILTPTEISQIVSGNNLLVTVESINADWFMFYYSLNDTNSYVLVNDSVIVSHGDGIAPDTTSFYFDMAQLSITNTITLKVVTGIQDTAFTGSITDPFYGVEDYQYVGNRSEPDYAQSGNQWTRLYLEDDNLYTINFFAYVYGWYDYADRINLYKWNILTNTFDTVRTISTPGAAYYPQFQVYRTSNYSFVMWNGESGVSGTYNLSRYKIATITYPNTISDWSESTVGVRPINVDTANTTISYEGWSYTLDPDLMTITARDLYNPDNNILVTDASAHDRLTTGNIDFFVYDSVIIVSNIYDNRQEARVYIVGNVFPNNIPSASDQVSFVLQGVTRNYFRGVYKNAILEYFPPIR